MKLLSLLLSSALSLAGGVGLAVAADHSGHDHAAMHGAMAPASQPLTDGLVKKVDKAGGRVTLTHGPLPNGMPGMTMAFRVKDGAWLDKLKEGDKIRFVADQVNGVMTLVQIERP